MCNKIPEDIFHLTLDCKFTKQMWKKIEKTLFKIIPKNPTEYEMAFGIQPTNQRDRGPTILRNWVTFSLRHHIMSEERKAYHQERYFLSSHQKFVHKFNHDTKEELKIKHLQYKYQGLQEKFEKIVTSNNAIATKVEQHFVWNNII